MTSPTRRPAPPLSGALACAALLLVLAPGPSPADQESFDETSDVVLVEVPVHVVARDGSPVRDLGPDDFRLWDEGDRQEIVGVRAIDLDLIAPTRAELPRELDRLPAVARRHFLLLFDLSFSTPSSIIRAREAAERFVLEDLHPTDLAAVATFSLEAGPQLVVTFTPDRAQLARAIETLGVPELLRRGRPNDPLRFVIDESLAKTYGDEMFSSGGAGRTAALFEHLGVLAYQADRAQRSFERRRITSWSRAMADMARALGSVEGRKDILYFSEGFDGRLLLGREYDPLDIEQQREQQLIQQGQVWFVDNDERFGNSDLMNDVREMVEEFRRADCAIQAVDIGGLRADGQVGTAGSGGISQVSRTGQDALFFIANETGGELHEDANDLGSQLERVLERTSVTYVLSYYPRDLELDGEYHKLKVEVDAGKKVRLSHRPGYYAPRGFSELHPLEKALLASEAIASATPRRDVGVQVLAAPFRAGPDVAYVPVIVEIEGGSLLVDHEESALPVEIYAYVTDAKGEMRDFFTQIVSLDVSQGRAGLAASGVKYYGHLDLAPGGYLLRVLVRNATTGRTGVASLDLEVPAWPDVDFAMLPPFFPQQGQWFLVKEKNDPGAGDSVVYPFVVKGEPFIPAARPEVRPGDQPRFTLVTYGLGAGDLQLASRWLGEGREPLPGRVELVERTVTGIDGLDKTIAALDVADLETGEYLLEIELTHPESGLRRASSIPVRVR